MQSIFEGQFQQKPEEKVDRNRANLWLNLVPGLIGSFIVFYILMGRFALEITSFLGVNWFHEKSIRVAGSGLAAFGVAYILSRIDGTLWGTYYVIVGYLLSLGLLLATALYLFRII
jgi:hypothetical protein